MSYNIKENLETDLNRVANITNISKQQLINICVDLSLPMLEDYFCNMLKTQTKENFENFVYSLRKVINQDNAYKFNLKEKPNT